ncbi:MAG TPA: ROK family protein [Vicinamibacterales bacterium]
MRDSHRPFRGDAVDSGARHAGHLRGLNIDRVLNIAIERPGTFTRAEIIQATGLSAPTVGSLTSHLIRTGVISDLGTAPSRGGRRPGLMEFNARHAYIAGIDLGPTRTRLAVADLRGKPIARQIITTPSDIKPHLMLGRIAAALRALMEQARVPAERLVVVIAGAPGAVNLDKGTVDMAPNLNGWTDVPMLKVLQQELETTVLIENDVNLALLGEHWQGAAQGHDTCAFIFVGTGIGSAILIDGTLHHGHSFMAGEIGVMCMAREYLERDFGSRGCLEMLAGLDALRARWPLEAQEDPAGWFAALLQRSETGDHEARRAIEETTDLIGIATANVAAVVDPSIVVLGGAMFAQAQPLVDAVRRVVHRISRTKFEVVLSALGKEAPLAGCLLIGAMEARRHLRQTLKVPTAVRRVQ